MNEENYGDDIWDEYMWEAHMDRMEKKSEEFRKFIEADSDQDLPRWLSLLIENSDKLEAFDAFIEEELEIEDQMFPEDYEDDWDDEWMDEEDDFLFDELEEEPFLDNDFIEDFDEGEEWKELSDEFTFSENGSIENLSVYNRGRELAVHALKWAEDIHSKFKSEALTEFVTSTLIISAKLAGGYSFGFETDLIGGNIACTKKALNAANKALCILENDLKKKPFMTSKEYKYLHTTLFELRNDIGIYVQELRERFNLGLE